MFGVSILVAVVLPAAVSMAALPPPSGLCVFDYDNTLTRGMGWWMLDPSQYEYESKGPTASGIITKTQRNAITLETYKGIKIYQTYNYKNHKTLSIIKPHQQLDSMIVDGVCVCMI